jgi:hypothetical protein
MKSHSLKSKVVALSLAFFVTQFSFVEMSRAQNGACCFIDFCFVTSELSCSFGGLFQGAGTTCNDPNICDLEGACCMPNGSCSVLVRSLCEGQGGSFQGFETTCDAGTCTPGACCDNDGNCTDETQGACENINFGSFAGPGILCSSLGPEPCLGACCKSFDNSCLDGLDLFECGELEAGTHQGPGTTCSDPTIDCPTTPATCWDCSDQDKGDANGDGNVTEPDFAGVAASWMLSTGQQGYFCCADFSRNGSVGMEDLVILAENWTTQGLNICTFASCP